MQFVWRGGVGCWGLRTYVSGLGTHSESDARNAGWLKCCFTSTETVGLLGTGAQDVHLDFHTVPELCGMLLMVM